MLRTPPLDPSTVALEATRRARQQAGTGVTSQPSMARRNGMRTRARQCCSSKHLTSGGRLGAALVCQSADRRLAPRDVPSRFGFETSGAAAPSLGHRQRKTGGPERSVRRRQVGTASPCLPAPGVGSTRHAHAAAEETGAGIASSAESTSRSFDSRSRLVAAVRRATSSAVRPHGTTAVISGTGSGAGWEGGPADPVAPPAPARSPRTRFEQARRTP